MRIGILTGGGDVPGLNAAIKAVVLKAAEEGHEVVGFRRGWGGLTGIDPSDRATATANAISLDPLWVRKIDRSGGTALHTSRTNPAKMKAGTVPGFIQGDFSGAGPFDVTPHVLSVLDSQGIDVLIPIGGDDTLSYGWRLHQEGFPVVAIPKTMDNDVSGTEYCIGFSTSITRSVGFVNNLRTSAGSHERIAVVELFGRYSGETSLVTAYLSGADRAIISEVPFDIDRLGELLVEDRENNPSHYSVVTISEGATMKGEEMVLSGEADAFGHRKLGGIGQLTGELIKERTGVNILYQQVAYLMRSGPPDVIDLMVGTNYGLIAATLAIAGESGRMAALRDGQYTHVAIDETAAGARSVDVDLLYDSEAYRPKFRDVLGLPMFLR